MNNAKNEIVVYQPNETVRLEVELHDESIWLTQLKIAELFGVQKAAISKHLKNIFEAGELQEPSVASKMETTAADGKRYKTAFYNLDAIIAVGYRVNSARATQFRIWATQVLKAYLLKGYAVNQRLNLLEDRVDRRMAKTEQDAVELKEKVDFFVQTSQPPVRGVFYNGQVFDASSFATKHMLSAKKSILLIDSWVDVTTLEMLAKKSRGVTVEIVTSRHGGKVSAGDVAKFNAQHGGLTVHRSKNFHLKARDKRLGEVIDQIGRIRWTVDRIFFRPSSRTSSRSRFPARRRSRFSQESGNSSGRLRRSPSRKRT